MRKKNYIFTNKKHSDKAIMSTILGIISLVSLGIVTYLSYSRLPRYSKKLMPPREITFNIVPSTGKNR